MMTTTLNSSSKRSINTRKTKIACCQERCRISSSIRKKHSSSCHRKRTKSSNVSFALLLALCYFSHTHPVSFYIGVGINFIYVSSFAIASSSGSITLNGSGGIHKTRQLTRSQEIAKSRSKLSFLVPLERHLFSSSSLFASSFSFNDERGKRNKADDNIECQLEQDPIAISNESDEREENLDDYNHHADNEEYKDESYYKDDVIPVTVLSGFLGAGKTTLLKNMLESNKKDGLNIAVIVNDVASINIDAKLIQQQQTPLGSSTIDYVNTDSSSFNLPSTSIMQLQNGCACCTLRGELLDTIQELVTVNDLRQQAADEEDTSEEKDNEAVIRPRPFDHIVVELSGISEPSAVRSNFQNAYMMGNPLMERVRLDTMITLLDATTYLKYLTSNQSTTPQEAPELFFRRQNKASCTSASNSCRPEGEEEDLSWIDTLPPQLASALLKDGATSSSVRERLEAQSQSNPSQGVSKLLIDQTECSDIIMVNKCDLLPSADREQILDNIANIINVLRPSIGVFRTIRGISIDNDKVDQDFMSLIDFLGCARGQGVVTMGVVDDLKESVAESFERKRSLPNLSKAQAEAEAETEKKEQEEVLHSSSSSVDSKSHHNHGHQHVHSHEHSHHNDHKSGSAEEERNLCDDPSCQDPTHHHSHSHDHEDPLELYNTLGSFVFTARRPFHPGRLNEVLQLMPVVDKPPHTPSKISSSNLTEEGGPHQQQQEENAALKEAFSMILRSKGFVWLAQSHVKAIFWSHSGINLDVSCLGRWWATLSQNKWPKEDVEEILKDFAQLSNERDASIIGDRRQELVFIGRELNDGSVGSKLIKETLNECLLRDDEWNTYKRIVDPDLEQQAYLRHSSPSANASETASSSSSTATSSVTVTSSAAKTAKVKQIELSLQDSFGILPMEIDMKTY